MKIQHFQMVKNFLSLPNQAMALAAIILVGSTACSHSPYSKPGSSEKELQEAIASCQAQQTASNLNAEIAATMSNPGMAGGGMTGGRMLERQKLIDECLRAQGWEPQ